MLERGKCLYDLGTQGARQRIHRFRTVQSQSSNTLALVDQQCRFWHSESSSWLGGLLEMGLQIKGEFNSRIWQSRSLSQLHYLGGELARCQVEQAYRSQARRPQMGMSRAAAVDLQHPVAIVQPLKVGVAGDDDVSMFTPQVVLFESFDRAFFWLHVMDHRQPPARQVQPLHVL